MSLAARAGTASPIASAETRISPLSMVCLLFSLDAKAGDRAIACATEGPRVQALAGCALLARIEPPATEEELSARLLSLAGLPLGAIAAAQGAAVPADLRPAKGWAGQATER